MNMRTLEWTSMEMLRFGNVALDVDRALLRDSKGAEVALRPKSLDLLLELARNPGRIISRDELFDAVWPNVTVTEDSIAQCVREVRRAIGDPEGRILRTIVKRGYCLDIEVQSDPSIAAPDPVRSVPIAEGRPSLVVLPFQSIPYDPDTEWFADGIVEEITTALSRFRSLFVIARNSAFTFKGQAVDVRDVGQRLGVRYVLEGSVRRALGQLRVTGQLVEAETGNHVWAERYDGVLSDVFELQDQITAAVAGVLEPSIRRAEMNRAVRKPTSDLTVYDLYLRALPGMYAWSKVGYESAKSLLEEAVARDPNFAQVRGMLAVLWEFGAYFGWESDIEAAKERALRHAREALASDSSDPQVMARCGFVLATFGGAHLRDQRCSIGRSLQTRIAPKPIFAVAGCRSGTAISPPGCQGSTSTNGSIHSQRRRMGARAFEPPRVSSCVNSTPRSRPRIRRSAARRTSTRRGAFSPRPSPMWDAKKRRVRMPPSSCGAIRGTLGSCRLPRIRSATSGWPSSSLGV
jgi:TolB-like protein